MPEIIKNVSEFNYCVGTVYGYNKLTREVEVYIPKLMPGIPEGQPEKEIVTDTSHMDIDINYRTKLKTASTITAKAKNRNDPMPDIGSKVMIFFIDENILYPIWESMNYANEYKVIDEEKYKKLYKLKIGEFETDVYEDDIITINLPDEFEIIKDFNNKNKTFNIKYADTNSNRIEDIENIIGLRTSFFKGQKISANGIYKDLEALEYKLQKVEEELYNLKEITGISEYQSIKLYDENDTYICQGSYKILDTQTDNYFIVKITVDPTLASINDNLYYIEKNIDADGTHYDLFIDKGINSSGYKIELF